MKTLAEPGTRFQPWAFAFPGGATLRELGIFAKYWQPGRVKTRLARSIGPVEASRLAEMFLRHLVRRMERVDARRSLYYWPAEAEAAFRSLAGNTWELHCQSPGDLGGRMHDFFQRSFARGQVERVVLIGSDSPTLPPQQIEAAFEILQTRDVVVGPSTDGGYCLIGMRHKPYALFDGIAWSTPDVLPATRSRLEQLSLSYELLSPWSDVDEVEDLARLGRELRGRREASERDLLLAVEQALQGVPGAGL